LARRLSFTPERRRTGAAGTRADGALRRAPTADRLDLPQAFRHQGQAPSYRQLDVVVRRLREQGIRQLDYDEELEDIAVENGSSGIVALDVHSAFHFGVEALYREPRHSRARGA
jgi:hypothetical protein